MKDCILITFACGYVLANVCKIIGMIWLYYYILLVSVEYTCSYITEEYHSSKALTLH